MESINYASAKPQLSRLMDQVLYGEPVEITRKNREPVVIISKAAYEAFVKADFYKRFHEDSK